MVLHLPTASAYQHGLPSIASQTLSPGHQMPFDWNTGLCLYTSASNAAVPTYRFRTAFHADIAAGVPGGSLHFCTPGFFRLCFAYCEPDIVSIAITRLASALLQLAH